MITALDVANMFLDRGKEKIEISLMKLLHILSKVCL